MLEYEAPVDERRCYEIKRITEKGSRALVLGLVLMMAVPPGTFGQQADQPVFKQEELEQILAPIALYPDSLLARS